MTIFTKEEIETMLMERGVRQLREKHGAEIFMEICHFLDQFTGDEKRTYCGWIKEFWDSSITPEEQEKIDTGELRSDDI